MMRLALCGGYFLVLLDVTVVNVALPSIGAGLHASPSGLAWVVDAYALPLAALLLAAGAIGDRLGHRGVVTMGFAGFGAASVVCALAPTVPVLVAGRALQGVCAALMLPGTLALLTESAPDDRARARLVGLWAAVGGCALPAGPFVGGVLAQTAGWRAVFWINVPVIFAALIPVLRAPRGRRARGRVDWAGAALLAVVLGAVVTAILAVSGVALLVAVVAAALLVAVERRAAKPLLAVPAAARQPLAAACVVAGLMNSCVLGSLFLLTQLFQDVHGLSPLRAGLLLLPGMLPLPLLGAVSGRLTHRLGTWRTAALGLALSALGFVGLAVTEGRPGVVLVVALAVWGSGLGILTPAIVTAALKTLPDTPGTASGASNTARQTGGALGVALFGAVAGSATGHAFGQHAAWLLAVSAVVFAAAAGYGLAVQADQRSTVISRNGPAGAA
jgi:DHA2 family methylenomycin A resistance protein-like MFS transporter